MRRKSQDLLESIQSNLNESVLNEKINKDNIEINKLLTNPNAGNNAQKLKDLGYELSTDDSGRVYEVKNPKTGRSIYSGDLTRDEKKKVDVKNQLDTTGREFKVPIYDDRTSIPKGVRQKTNRRGTSKVASSDFAQYRDGISKNIQDYKTSLQTRTDYEKRAKWDREDIERSNKKIADLQKDIETRQKWAKDNDNRAIAAENKRQEILAKVRANRNKKNESVELKEDGFTSDEEKLQTLYNYYNEYGLNFFDDLINMFNINTHKLNEWYESIEE